MTKKGLSPGEMENQKATFFGKLVVYVIHDQEEMDYPPANRNLFARCNRSVITLEWILDACNLPRSLREADKITFLFEKEGAEIEVYYKDLKPSER